MPRRLFLLFIPVLLLACNTLGAVTPAAATGVPAVEPTALPPTEIPLPTAPPGPTAIPGWLTYRNHMMGYAFDYPPEGLLQLSGVRGYPTDELPAGVEPGQYIATLEATYTEALCAGVELPAASFVLWSPQEAGGRYSGPCGVTGIGVYDIRKDSLPVLIDGESLTLGITRLYEVGTDTLVDEFGHLRLADGTLMTLMSHWQEAGLTYDDYLADRAALLQLMSTYRREP